MNESMKAAERLFGLVCEDNSDKIVSNNLKNAKIIVKELVDAINKAKDSSSKMDIEKNIEDAIKKCDLICNNLEAALTYSKAH